MKCIAVITVVGLAGAATAGITQIGPFTGQCQETFEGFQNYLNNPNFYEDANGPFAIMGGTATMFGPNTAIYEPNAGATFGLGSNGSAQVFEGERAAGLDNPGSWTFTFGTGVLDFGGYWSYYPDGGVNPTFDFYDTNGAYLGSDTITVADGSGALHWAGWNSTTPLGFVVVSGEYVVVDYLQANKVPAPGALALIGLGGLAAARRRRA